MRSARVASASASPRVPPPLLLRPAAALGPGSAAAARLYHYQQQQHCKGRRLSTEAAAAAAATPTTPTPLLLHRRCRPLSPPPPRALALPDDDSGSSGSSSQRQRQRQQEQQQQAAAAAWALQQQQRPFLNSNNRSPSPFALPPAAAALARSLAALLTSPALPLTLAAGGLLAAAALLCDAAVVAAAVKASLKLMLLCGAVAALQARGSLPAETSRVLSQVAFNLTIPCMLATTTARTLASTTDPAQLVAVPLVAMFHVGVGALLGKWASAAVEGRCPLSRALFGWGPLLAAPSASREARAAAEATARAVGVSPLAAEALLPPARQAAAANGGAGDAAETTSSAAAALAGRPPNSEAIVRLACAFANVFTLPLLYLATLIPAGSPELAAATAYVALYHAAWSPLLWTYGYSKLLLGGMAGSNGSGSATGASGASGLGVGAKPAGFSASASGQEAEAEGRRRREREAELRRRRAGGVLGRVGSSGVVVPAEIVGGAGSSSPETGNGSGSSNAAAASRPHQHADDGATPAEALVRGLWAASAPLRASIGPLRASIAKLLTPPVAAVLVGLALGATDLGKAIIGVGGGAGAAKAAAAAATAAAAASSASPVVASLLAWDASVILGLLRCCWDVAETLATATLALQAIVLASSLFGGAGTAGASATAGAGPAVAASAAAATTAASPAAATAAASDNSSSSQVVDIEQFASPSPATSSTSSAEEDEHEAAGLPRSPLRQHREKQAASASSASAGRAADAAGASLLSQLRPRGAWEWRVLLAVGAVRFLIVPAISVATLLWLRSSGLAPLPAGKACMLALLLPSIAPPGQNLALVVQLSPSTSALTAPMSRLLLQLYALAVLPVTLWVAAVVSWL